MSQHNALEGRGVHRCMDVAPKALSGHLETVKCTLECGPHGTHTGDHKAHRTIPGVGRTTWRWKNKPTTQPPVVNLPPARIERVPLIIHYASNP